MRRVRATVGSILAGGLAIGGLAAVSAISPAASQAAPAAASANPVAGPVSSCQLGNGVKHVVNIIFDNVHYNRDNPNVPSDLEMIPNLENFIENNGALLSNNHTPLIAHTADDSLTTYTGLYGDRRHADLQRLSRCTTRTGPITPSAPLIPPAPLPTGLTPCITRTAHRAAADTNPSLVYSPMPPATSSRRQSPRRRDPGPLGTLHPGRLQRG